MPPGPPAAFDNALAPVALPASGPAAAAAAAGAAPAAAAAGAADLLNMLLSLAPMPLPFAEAGAPGPESSLA